MIALYKRLNITKNELKRMLKKMYKTKSQQIIANELKCDVTCIEKWFKIFNIKCRTFSEAQRMRVEKHVKIFKNESEVLTGLLLSDLHIECSHGFQARAAFVLKYLEFASEIIKNLENLNWSNPKYNEKALGWYSKTKNYMEIKYLRDKWYKEKIKIVPKDIKITPKVLYWWFLGDGFIGDYCIYFCTEAFTKEENMFLSNEIKKLGIDNYVTPSNRIKIVRKSVLKFIDIIGICKVDCYKYKWNVRIKRKNYKWIME